MFTYRSLLIFLFVLSAYTGTAQDKIFLKNGNEVVIEVIGSDSEYILGKSTNPADKQVYKYPKSEILYLQYEDGRKEYFDEQLTDEDTIEAGFVEEEEIIEPEPDLQSLKKKRRRMFYIGTFGGANRAISKYGNAGAYDHGYAKTGGYFNLETALLFGGSFGMGITIGGSSNKMKEEAIERKWELPTVDNYQVSTGSYSHFYFMIGPYFSIQAEKRLFIDFKLRYGISISTEPSYEMSYVDPASGNTVVVNNRDEFGSTGVSGSLLSFNLGGLLRYNINNVLGVALELDWMLLPYFINSKQNTSTYDSNGNLIDKQSSEIEIIELVTMNYIGIGIYLNLVNPNK